MELEELTEGLPEILKDLTDNPMNTVKRREIIEVFNRTHPVVTIDSSKRLATFHAPYSQTASSIEELKPLIDFLKEKKYNYNLA